MKINTSNPVYVVAFTAVVSAVFTAAIMVLNVSTRPAVERNEKLFRQRGLMQILFVDPKAANLPGPVESMTQEQIVELFAKRTRTVELPVPGGDGMIEVVKAYRKDLPVGADGDAADLVGYAFPVSGVGFWDRIRGYLAVDPTASYTLGIFFLQQSETPGLGARITEPEFRNQFRPAGDRKVNITPSKEADKYLFIEKGAPAAGSWKASRHVDAITGATQTSTKVNAFVNRDIARFRAAAIAAKLIPDSPTPQ